MQSKGVTEKVNLLEHYIKEIHSVKDITSKVIERCGYEPSEPLLEVDLTYDCYGVVTRNKRIFCESDFEIAKKQGYFLA